MGTDGETDDDSAVGLWIAIGAGAGTAMGLATGEFALWVGIGIAVGVAIGATNDEREE